MSMIVYAHVQKAVHSLDLVYKSACFLVLSQPAIFCETQWLARKASCRVSTYFLCLYYCVGHLPTLMTQPSTSVSVSTS